MLGSKLENIIMALIESTFMYFITYLLILCRR